MNINQVKQSLPFMLKNKIVPFLWGSQGVGKTQTIKQYCKENDLQCVVLNTATQEVGDLIGLLVKNDQDGTAYHTRPRWFPTTGKGIVFLDELNRAQPDVVQSLFPFILSGTLHTHQLPEGWRVVAAGNYNSERFNVTDTSDAAFLSRFCHIDFVPTTSEWVAYASSQGAESVSDFIHEQPGLLELDAKRAGRLDDSFITPDRRAWLEGIGALEAEHTLPEDLRYELYCGLVGKAAAAAFITWKGKAQKSIRLNDILTKYSSIRTKVKKMTKDGNETRFDLLNGPLEEFFANLGLNPQLLETHKDALTNMQAYLIDLPIELAMKFFTRCAEVKKFSGRDSLLNDPEFAKNFAKVA